MCLRPAAPVPNDGPMGILGEVRNDEEADGVWRFER
jgi:hypothetical protein